MILVTKKNNKISLSGHSLYADFGKDIVCSSVSSIVITTINGIIAIDEEAISYEFTKDGMKITILKSDNVTLKLIQNMMELLDKLSQDYPKNIQIKEGV